MPNVMGVLRQEIRRLARKETKQELSSMRKQLAQMRRLLAESRRRVDDLEARSKQVLRAAKQRGTAAQAEDEDEDGPQVRFSPAWVKKHRSKLGMSRLHYAQLVGVSPQTIMGWEAGRSRPRRGALRAWRTIRAKGVRELRAMLNGGAATEATPGRKRRVRRRLKRVVRRARVRGAIRRVRVARAVGRGRVRRTVKRARVRRAVKRAVRKRTVGGRVRAAKKK